MIQHTTQHPPHWQLDHVGIAVRDLERAVQMYSQAGGTTVTLRETLPSHGVELAFLNTGAAKLELLAPLASSSSPLARFLDSRGPGLHHICYQVSDINSELSRLKGQGYTLIDACPRPGAGGTKIAFLHPSCFEGVLTELCQYPVSAA